MNKIIVTLVGIGLLGTQAMAQQDQHARVKALEAKVKQEALAQADALEQQVPVELKAIARGLAVYKRNIANLEKFDANFILQSINNVMDPYLEAHAKYGEKVYVLNDEIIKAIPAGWGGTLMIIPFLVEYGNDTNSETQNKEYATFKKYLRERPNVVEELSFAQAEQVEAFMKDVYTPFVNIQKESKTENAGLVLQGALLSVYEPFLSKFAINVRDAENGDPVQAKDPVVVKALMKKMNKPFVAGWTTTPIVLSDYLSKHIGNVNWYAGDEELNKEGGEKEGRDNKELRTFKRMLENASK